MKTMMWLAAGLVAIGAAAAAQQTGFSRTILQQTDLSIPGREAVTAIAEFQPGVSAPRHIHPGEEIGYVVEGTVEVEVAGKATVVPAGKTFVIPAGTAHGAKNVGSGVAKILATYIVEKGKPLATPAQ